MQHSLLKGFYLQDLLIEPASGRVSGPGVEAHLKPKAVEVLLYLAARPFELVEREELLQAVWGDDGASSDALTHAVSELRSCCHDHANDPSLIQTVSSASTWAAVAEGATPNTTRPSPRSWLTAGARAVVLPVPAGPKAQRGLLEWPVLKALAAMAASVILMVKTSPIRSTMIHAFG